MLYFYHQFSLIVIFGEGISPYICNVNFKTIDYEKHYKIRSTVCTPFLRIQR